MCGICGIYSKRLGDSVVPTVARMCQALEHRGPDGHGQFVSLPCSIAARRLAIIDLATGQQPITNEDETLVIIFNGEIYNYQELRKNLERSGRHRFKTQSDTEVILHLYEDYRERIPALLNGMFAFCIYDIQEQSFFLARDRFGEKPLYYSVSEDSIAFSSELFSLLQWNDLERRLDLRALPHYLCRGYVPAPLTLFEGVRQLQPGHWLKWREGVSQTKAYYVPEYTVNAAFNDQEVVKSLLRETILKAVKSQMMSEVSLGAFLSGGIDSSTIVAAMQLQSTQPVKTFTVRFEHSPYDESHIARQVAQHLGTDHHEFVIDNASFDSADLWRIIRHVGQPFGDSSAIPSYFISKHIRDYVTVCLSGDGGDEMFAGYDYFRWGLNIDDLARTVPAPVIGFANSILNRLTPLPVFRESELLRRARNATNVASLPQRDRLEALGRIFESSELDDLILPSIMELSSQEADDQMGSVPTPDGSLSWLRQMMWYRTAGPLADDMLVKIDRMSMAASLEVRAPLLSVEVSALAGQLPEHLLINRGVTKYILREAVRDWLPEAVFSHPKTGFSIPLHMVQNAQYEELCRELILNIRQGLMTQLFCPDSLNWIVERGLKRKRGAADVSVYRASHQVWSLLQLAAWADYFEVTL